MKVLLIVIGSIVAACWGFAILADWFIGKVEREGKDGM